LRGNSRGKWSTTSNTDQNQIQLTLNGYTQLVTDRIKQGWSCYLVTILFQQLPGSQPTIISRMKQEIQRVYSTLITRVHRKPRTASPDELPVLIGAVDLPVNKTDRSSSPLVRCNGGLHFHALILVPDRSRMREPLQDHFHACAHLYGLDGAISKIDVRRVTDRYERVVDYVFKTIKRGRIAYDEGALILPRARDELTSRRLERSAADRPIVAPDFYRVKRLPMPSFGSLPCFGTD
jgi:hypothetical protein